MSLPSNYRTRRELAHIYIRLESWQGMPTFDLDHPAYLASGDIDDAPIDGFIDYYRATLHDSLAKKRLVLESPLTPQGYVSLLQRLASEIEIYLKEREAAAATTTTSDKGD